MSADEYLPAYSQQFQPASIQELSSSGPMAQITPEWAWGGSTGRGIKVAVVDSGIEWDHPAVGGAVCSGVFIEYDETAENSVRYETDDQPQDASGHGTACAGIIHALAPEAELQQELFVNNFPCLIRSIKVLSESWNHRNLKRMNSTSPNQWGHSNKSRWS
jgi:hypothetical protein